MISLHRNLTNRWFAYHHPETWLTTIMFCKWYGITINTHPNARDKTNGGYWVAINL